MGLCGVAVDAGAPSQDRCRDSFPALDMAELPPSSEDNKELSGHL